ncbi:MAG: hypothetical protein ACO2Y5_05995 [Nitrosopumilaceae archaeon]
MKLSVVFTLTIIGSAGFSMSALAEETSVPDWVKNNALWWAEGKITEQEYLNAIQFLIEEGIITVSVVDETAAEALEDPRSLFFESAREIAPSIISPFSKHVVPEDDRASGYIVRISGGEFTDTQTFDTFGRFEPGQDPIFINSLRSQGLSAYFMLESLPSKDKPAFYDLISKYYNPGKTPEPFDVEIDGLSGDGSTIVTFNYNRCQLEDYFPYLQNFTFLYPLSNEVGAEIRDRAIFACQGLQVEVRPDKEQINMSSLRVIPEDADRAKKFVVHFYNGEIEKIFSTTFPKFAPSIDSLETPFVTITIAGNPVEGSPQFFLESVPSYDKRIFYEFLSRYVNPTKIPEPFDVSVDVILGDNTILQRWSYSDCELVNYQMRMDDSMLYYPYSNQMGGEIKDKTDFSCAGNDVMVQGIHQIDDYPIKDVRDSIAASEELDALYAQGTPLEKDRAMSYRIHAFNGELEVTRTTETIPKFVGLVQNRGPLTPLHHDKQYDVGFYMESLPDKNKIELYNFISEYVNPGKQPEPIDVDVEILTGDGRVLETLQYRSCEAIDFDWYSQERMFTFQITNQIDKEIREKATFYCDGYTIYFE